MTQTVLKEKLARYLELTHAKETSDLRKDLLSVGYCYGLSVCHASMKWIDKLAWWEAALIRIANWNGKSKTLKRKANLPDSLNPNETVGQVFERVLNYVVFNHVHDQKSYNDIRLDQIEQPRFLIPEKNYFDMLGPDKKIKQVVSRQCAAGQFKTRQIKLLLRKKLAANTICLIHSTYHTISVSYKKPYWMLYDPNYPHDIEKGGIIHKKFASKKSLVAEIVNILGNSIAIEYASLQKEISISKWKDVVKKYSFCMLKEYGLHIIVQEIPNQIPEILSLAMKYKQGPDQLVQALSTVDHEEWYGFHKLLYYSSKHLPLVLEYAARSKEGPSLITQILAMTICKGTQTGLFQLLHYGPQYFPNVLDLVERAPEDTEYLAKALLHKNDDMNGWDHLKSKAPECKKRVTQILLNNLKHIHSDTLKALIKTCKLPVVRIHKGTFFQNRHKPNKILQIPSDELQDRPVLIPYGGANNF